MPSILPGFEYDIFISYRQNDNRSSWVTEFVKALQEELAATIKDPVSIYFDTNPHDGLLETHNIDKSLEGKLRCLIFIPIISQTYCDTKSFAWQHEFCAFNKLAKDDQFGRDIKLGSGNVASRILPIKIHDLDAEDKALLEDELGSNLRGVEFIYKEPGVNRPLNPGDDENKNLNKTRYRNQMNKVANAVKEIIGGLKNKERSKESAMNPSLVSSMMQSRPKPRTRALLAKTSVVLIFLFLLGYIVFNFTPLGEKYIAGPIQKSIAVLPFKNFSTNEETQYFADGVMEAVLNHLSKIKNLKVISRTSVEVYRKSPKVLKEIARELDVNHILEGSVQRDGNTIRITVQLINANKDEHLWAENYDRELKDIFSIQSEIAGNIAEQLKATMNPEERKLIQETPVYNMTAYDEYLKGRQKLVTYLINKKDNDLKAAIGFYSNAIKIDSTLAPAYAGLAEAHGWYVFDRDFLKEDFLDSVLMLCNKALAIDPNLSNAYRGRGFYYFLHSTDLEKAVADVEHAIELVPNSADNYITMGQINMYRKQEKSLESYLKGLQLDPNSTFKTIIYSDISQIYINAGDAGQSELYARKALEIEPGYSTAYWCLVHGKMVRGQFTDALSIADEWLKISNKALRYLPELHTHLGNYQLAEKYFIELEKQLPNQVNYQQRYAVVLWKLGRKKEALQKFEAVLKEYELMIKLERPYGIGVQYDLTGVNAFLGRNEEAHKWLSKWERYGLHVGLDRYAQIDPLFESLWSDPEFKSVVQRLQDRNAVLARKLKEIEKKKI